MAGAGWSCGEHDLTLALVVTRRSRCVPGTYPGTGHCAHWEQVEEVVAGLTALAAAVAGTTPPRAVRAAA